MKQLQIYKRLIQKIIAMMYTNVYVYETTKIPMFYNTNIL